MLGGAHLGKLPIEPSQLGEQVGAIVLDRGHHVVRAALLDHAPGGVVAGVHRIEGHDAPGEVEPGEQGTNGRDLVALVLYRLLSEDDSGAVLGGGDEQAGFGADGSALRGVRAKRLKAVRIVKKGLIDFDVVWGKGERAFSARLIASWNRSKREYRFLVTNLPRSRYSAKAVDQVYRLRWQIELLFKEWKSYANLHAFNTANPGIAEGLIWAAVGAAAMKRYLAHMTQVLHGVEVSTRKVAMCAHQVLGRVIDVLISKSRDELHEALRVAVEYLAVNAIRSHPKRERRTGRLQFGIKPVLNVCLST